MERPHVRSSAPQRVTSKQIALLARTERKPGCSTRDCRGEGHSLQKDESIRSADRDSSSRHAHGLHGELDRRPRTHLGARDGGELPAQLVCAGRAPGHSDMIGSFMRSGVATVILVLGCSHTAPSTPAAVPTAPHAEEVPSVMDLESLATPGYSPNAAACKLAPSLRSPARPAQPGAQERGELFLHLQRRLRGAAPRLSCDRNA